MSDLDKSEALAQDDKEDETQSLSLEERDYVKAREKAALHSVATLTFSNPVIAETQSCSRNNILSRFMGPRGPVVWNCHLMPLDGEPHVNICTNFPRDTSPFIRESLSVVVWL